MEHLFLSFELSVLVKQKGFDEQCFGYWEMNKYDESCPKIIINYTNQPSTNPGAKLRPKMFEIDNKNSSLPQWAISAPIKQQIIDWLIKKDIDIRIVPIYNKGIQISWKVLGLMSIADRTKVYCDNKNNDKSEYNSYSEAMNEAIKEALNLI